MRYLATSADEVFAVAEGSRMVLPVTLDALERRVIALLYADWMHKEIRAELGLSKNGLYAVLEEVKAKLADWRPSAIEREPRPTPPLPRALRSQPIEPSPAELPLPAASRLASATGAIAASSEPSPAMIPTGG
jgi:hypothetical protein